MEKALDKALEGMILSASGWRGVFAADGGEESRTPEISAPHRIIAAAAAMVFAAYLKESRPKTRQRVLVGTDTRPTGAAIADSAIRGLLAEGCAVDYASVTAAPEIMAYTRSRPEDLSGFIYITASHNPIGHNGIKFGLTDGGVLAPEASGELVARFRAFMAGPDRVKKAEAAIEAAGKAELEAVYSGVSRIKAEALSAYMGFTKQVTGGTAALNSASSNGIFSALAEGIRERPLGIAADLNGSARTASIDREFLSSLGISYHALNSVPGEIAHRIVPEGESLEPCRLYLEELHQKDSRVILGYTPDCDGDRGNLVVWDEGSGHGRVLEAQEVFALACVSELAHLVWTEELSYDNKGNAQTKAAVAVNDPTSLRIDRIARAFDAAVFRSEVGEANVVGLARRLREQGYTVRILGEGSAGGNITYPSAVRDPINTVMSMIKLLTIRTRGERKGFFELWCDLSDQAETYRPDFTLSDIIASLPAFVTTGSYTDDALLRVKTADHGLLKERYQAIFLKEWEERKEHLKSRYGIAGWEAAAYKGLEEKRGISRFSDAGRGGLKIIFTSHDGAAIAAIWMRGSATEPVFRVMADAEGSDKRIERELIEWQRSMVIRADQG